MSKVTDLKLRNMCQELHKKLLNFEEDEMQVHCMVTDTLDTINPEKTITKLNQYLDNEYTSKTRNDIYQFIEKQGIKSDEDDEETEVILKAEKIIF